MPKTPGIKRLDRDYYFVQVSRTDPRLRKRRFKRRWIRGSYAEAEAAREDALAELEREINGHLGAYPTLTDYVQRWLEARAPDLKPSTRAKYLNDLERHILPGLGHLEIAEIRPRDVELMLTRDRGAPGSKKNRLSLLRALAKDALADGVTERDFCARVKITVPDPYSDDEPNLLDPDQIARVLAEIPSVLARSRLHPGLHRPALGRSLGPALGRSRPRATSRPHPLGQLARHPAETQDQASKPHDPARGTPARVARRPTSANAGRAAPRVAARPGVSHGPRHAAQGDAARWRAAPGLQAGGDRDPFHAAWDTTDLEQHRAAAGGWDGGDGR